EDALSCRYERRYGSFVRRVPLPAEVDADKVEAEAKDGVLSITLPKREETKPKRIRIKAR
ncbi:MAG: Hsp20/alpha crystallin family protein, partial [Planctomycetota bacterium]